MNLKRRVYAKLTINSSTPVATLDGLNQLDLGLAVMQFATFIQTSPLDAHESRSMHFSISNRAITESANPDAIVQLDESAMVPHEEFAGSAVPGFSEMDISCLLDLRDDPTFANMEGFARKQYAPPLEIQLQLVADFDCKFPADSIPARFIQWLGSQHR